VAAEAELQTYIRAMVAVMVALAAVEFVLFHIWDHLQKEQAAQSVHHLDRVGFVIHSPAAERLRIQDRRFNGTFCRNR
jgi:hypothetical protein